MNANKMTLGAGSRTKLLAAIAVLAVAFVVVAAVPAVATESDANTTIPVEVDAIDKLTGSTDGTYVLKNDFEVNSSINITANVVLDLNGYKLTGNNCDTVVVTGKLTVQDSSKEKDGTIDAISHQKVALKVKSKAEAILNGGVFDRSQETGLKIGGTDVASANSFYTILNHGKLTINDGTIVKNFVAENGVIVNNASSAIVNGFGNASDDNCTKTETTLIINGGTFIGGLNTIKNDDYGNLNIKDGSFTNYVQVAVQNHNVATIDGGNFDGAQSAIHNHPCDASNDKGELTINGGTFKYASGYADIWDNGTIAGKITVGKNVNISLKDENALTAVTLSEGSSITITDGSKLPVTVTNGTSSATFSNIVAKNNVEISAGSVIISGTMDASAASAAIASAGNNSKVVLKNLTITTGTLSLSDVTIDGKVTVKEDATISATSNVAISANGNLIVAGKVTGTALTNDGTITLISPSAEIPSAIDGTGSIDASGAQSEGTLSGTYDTTTTFTRNQIITATGNITLVKGTVFTFKGTFIIPEGVTVTIEDGARLIAADATGKIINKGTIVVESSVADGALYLSDTATIENNGTIDLAYDGTSDQWTAYLKQGTFVNNGTLTVGEGSNLILGESGKKLDIENNGTIVINGEIAYRTAEAVILNYGQFQMNGKTYTDFTVYQMSTDACVEFNGFTNAYTTSNSVTITVSDEKYKSDDNKYDHTTSTVAVTAGYKDAVSGVKIALIAEKNENGIFVPKFVISGEITVDTDEENGTAYAAIVTTGDNTVSDSLTLGENVTLTIDGTLDVSGQITAVKNSSIGFAATTGVLTVTGKITIVSTSGLTDGVINASEYVITQTTSSDKTYVYTTLATAVADGAAKIDVLGTTEISESITIPSGTTVTISNAMTISDEGFITFSEGSVLKNNGTIDVDGVLYIEDKKNTLKTVGDINSEVVIEGEKDKTYCNVTYALNNAASGSTVKLSEDNRSITIDKSMTIPAGVTLDTNGVNVIIAEKVVLTVDGTLQITSPSVITLNGTGNDKAKIVLNGTIASPDNAISDDLGIAGAFYSITIKTNTTYYAKPVADAAAIITTVDDATITLKGGDLVVGDVTFAGTSDMPATVNVYTKLTASTITLDLASIVFKSATDFDGTITNGTGTVDLAGDATTNFEIVSTTSNDKKALTVSGQFNDSDKDDKFIVSGEVVAKNATLSVADVDGLLKIAKGTTEITDLTVDGTVEVQNGATLAASTIEVFGTLAAAEATAAGTDAGAVSVTDMFVGISKNDSTRTYPVTAAAASVSGEINATGYAVVADGSTVPESMTKNVKSTAYFIGSDAYVTVYAKSTTKIGIVNASVDNANWTGWYADSKTMTNVDDKNVGDAGYETVYAIVNYNIYNVTIVLGAGIENVAIDGNLVVDGRATGLKAGSHTVTYTLENGYSGTATLTVNGEKQSGMTFNVSGTTTEYQLQLSGVTASGYTPVTPVTPSDDDDGMSLTDILLIVLVVLIVIMAIIVAMRLMRS